MNTFKTSDYYLMRANMLRKRDPVTNAKLVKKLERQARNTTK